jgi:hypothetical protein
MFFLKLRDLIEDKQGYLDEKRMWAHVFFVSAIVFIFRYPDGWIAAGGLAGIGISLLTIAGAQDGIVPKEGK